MYSSVKKSSSRGSPASAAWWKKRMSPPAQNAPNGPSLPCRRDRHALDRRVVAPGQQRGGEIADHGKRKRVERLGPVQRDQARTAADFRLDQAHRRCLHPTSSLITSAPITSAPPASTAPGTSPAPSQASRCRRSPRAAPTARSRAPSARAHTPPTARTGMASCTRPSRPASRYRVPRPERQGQRQRRRDEMTAPTSTAGTRSTFSAASACEALHHRPVHRAGQRHAERHQRAGECAGAELNSAPYI